MRRKNILIAVVITLLGLISTAQVAEAQLHMIAQKNVTDEIVLTPIDPTVDALTSSQEIMSLDVPPAPTARYLYLSSCVTWKVDFGEGAPVFANFRFSYTLSSPALPQGIGLFFAQRLVYMQSEGAMSGFQSQTSEDAETITRQSLQETLLAENPSLSASSARTIIDNLFRQGFHVSIYIRIRSQNVTNASILNPNVTFFAETQSQNHQ